MPPDSSANLLFTIGANSSDAEANVQRFRGILSKDLAGMKAEFGDWSTKVFGDLSTVSGAMTALSAAAAASVVALGAAFVAAGQKAAVYALQIEDGSKKTGISAENMSRLRYAAEVTQTSYEGLVGGLTKFASTLYAAQDPASKQAEVLHRLGISQKEIEAGSKDMLPVLYKVADAFHSDMTAVERTAVARQLFSRGGAELLDMLSKGSAALKGMGAEADRFGKVIGEDGIRAAKMYKAEIAALKAEFEGLQLAMGKDAMPIMNQFMVGLEALFGGLKNVAEAGPGKSLFEKFLTGMDKANREAWDRLRAAAAAPLEGAKGLEAPGADGKKTEKTVQDFTGLSDILDQVRGRMADLGGEEARLAFENSQLSKQVDEAARKLSELSAAGNLDKDALRRELAAFDNLPAEIAGLAAGKMADLNRKRVEEAAKTAVELEKIDRERWSASGKAMAADLQLSVETEAKRTEVYRKSLQELQAHLNSMLAAEMTHAQRLRFQYGQDQAEFSAAEKAKVAECNGDEARIAAIRAQFAAIRKASLEAYLGELNALKNSTGWQGVFGDEFASAIRGNEELLRNWAASANQSLLMVAVAGESTTESLQRGFGNFSKAMGANIAQAIVYKTSIGEAMRAAAASSLESIAAESIVQAIYATALGFLRLAHHDYPGATSAFTAAAIFGSVGAVAAVAGRAVAGQQAGAGAAGSGSGTSTSSGGTADSSGGSGSSQGPRVVVYVSGPIVGASGIEEFTDMLNEAVQGRDVRLVATQVKQDTRALR